MYELKNVSKKYSDIVAIESIDFTISQGSIVGIVGKSGSGKSTLLRLLNLLETPSTGELFIYGKSVSSLTKKEIQQQKQEIGVVFQHYNLLNNRTVIENVHLPLKLIGQKNMIKARELLAFVGLSGKEEVYPAQLSGGEKQRVAIARALIRDPKILLCDEATSSLDEENTEDIVRLLQKIHRELRPTIFFVSHELQTVKQLCEQILVMEYGRLVGELTNEPVPLPANHLSYFEKVARSLA